MFASPADGVASAGAAFLAASKASLDATVDAIGVQREQPSPDRDRRLLAAVNRMAELQVEALAAFDQLIQRGVELNADRELMSVLREGRAELAVQLQRTLAEVDRLTG